MQALSDFIFKTRYARHVNNTRESWGQAVDRVRDMHIRKFPALTDEITEAFEYVRRKEVLPSMRALQRAGEPIERNNLRIYNCAATPIDRPRAFAEYFYLLLCGCGVGIGVRTEDIEKLPRLPKLTGTDPIPFTIPDSIEGWAQAVEHLVNRHLAGKTPLFDASLIRPKGAPISSGGLAPGPDGLVQALNSASKILSHAAGRKLTSLEAYDICMHLSEAVLAGGVRRSATIALFSPGDHAMYSAKTGNWYETNPQRQLSNNSVVLNRNNPEHRIELDFVVEHARMWGDPGVFWTDGNSRHLTNPCGEIGLEPYTFDGKSGVAFCNLTSINGATVNTSQDLVDRAKAASFIGTLQASYTDFPYLSDASKQIAERDALVGVSICGFTDAPEICLDFQTLQRAAAQAVRTNEYTAELIGIRPAARVTCVKPDGTTSLILGGIAAGAGTHHAAKYFRRVQNIAIDPVYRYFAAANPQLCDVRVGAAHTHVVTFPLTAPSHAILREHMNAAQFLEHIAFIQENWVNPGTTRGQLAHSVSHTVDVEADEWASLPDLLWQYRERLGCVSMLASFGDKDHPQAPREAVVSPTEHLYHASLDASIIPVDWANYQENQDFTNFSGESACAGGACVL